MKVHWSLMKRLHHVHVTPQDRILPRPLTNRHHQLQLNHSSPDFQLLHLILCSSQRQKVSLFLAWNISINHECSLSQQNQKPTAC